MAIYEGTQPYVFLSYAHLDSDRVLPIFRSLEEGNYRIWYDGGIEAGTEWPDYIAEHLEKSGCFLAFISKNYLDSQNCKQEINYALDLKIPVLVIYMEDVTLTGGLRMRLGMVQALFYHRYGSEAAFLAALFRSALLTPCLGSRQNQSRGQSGRSGSTAVPSTPSVPAGRSAVGTPVSRAPSAGKPSSAGSPAPSTSGYSVSSTSSFTYTGGVFVNGNNNSVSVGGTNGGSGSGWSYSGTGMGGASLSSIVIRSGEVYNNSGTLQGATVERGGTLINTGIISGGVHLSGGTLQNSGIVSGAVTGTGFLRNTGTVSGYVSPDVTYI